MGDVREHRPVLLIMAVFSRHRDAFDWARRKSELRFGPIALVSDSFEFKETQFYERTMGPGIRKEFWVFERLVDPAELPAPSMVSTSFEFKSTASLKR